MMGMPAISKYGRIRARNNPLFVIFFIPRNRLTLWGKPMAMVKKITGVARIPTRLEKSCVGPTWGSSGRISLISAADFGFRVKSRRDFIKSARIDDRPYADQRPDKTEEGPLERHRPLGSHVSAQHHVEPCNEDGEKQAPDRSEARSSHTRRRRPPSTGPLNT